MSMSNIFFYFSDMLEKRLSEEFSKETILQVDNEIIIIMV